MTDRSAQWVDERRELMLDCDERGRITWADAKAVQKLGPCVGRSFFDLVAPGVEVKAKGFFERGRAEKVGDTELPLVVDGSVATFSFCARPDGAAGVQLLGTSLPEDYAHALRQTQASIAEVVELNRLVGRQRRELLQKNQALELASAQVTQVLECITDAFFSVDATWRILLVNHVQEQTFGARRADTVGRVLWDLLPAADLEAAPRRVEFERCMSERVPVQFVEHDPRRDLWTSVRAYPTAAGGIAVFSRDVSVERRAGALLELQADFEQKLIGIVSHDLRNPLGAIQMSAECLLTRRNLDGRSAVDASRILSSARFAIRLVRDLLDYTQARLGGGIPVRMRAVGLREVVSRALEQLGAVRSGRDVRLLPGPEVSGDWDEDRIAQVVSNLVTNALTYGPSRDRPPDSVSADCPVVVAIGAEDDGATLSVHNGGAPIPADRLSSIFEPLRRGHDSGSDRSVGLGLYIVREIAKAHHGTVEVESSEERGTTFTLRLPRARSDR